VVRGQWKLIKSPTTGELYNISNDPGERNNVFATRLKVLDELRALLDQFHANGNKSPFE
jgi:hypothetical protein